MFKKYTIHATVMGHLLFLKKKAIKHVGELHWQITGSKCFCD